jgi:hypothetical protein
MKLSATLRDAQTGHAAWVALWTQIKPHLFTGRHARVEVLIGPQSRQQQNLYHDLIEQISEQAKHLGATWDDEDWKRLLLDRFSKETGRPRGRVIPNLSGDGVVEVGLLSRKFSKTDANEFIEWLYAWGAENGIRFSAPEYMASA